MWMDTRDMTADGLTKCSVDRVAVHLLMSGEIKIVHEPKIMEIFVLRVPSETHPMKYHLIIHTCMLHFSSNTSLPRLSASQFTRLPPYAFPFPQQWQRQAQELRRL